MSDFLERDVDYEPVTLPSAAELLHWGDSGTLPGTGVPGAIPEGTPSPIPPVPPLPAEEVTRFLPRARPGRFLVASVVTAGLFAGIAWGAAAIGWASGAAGIGVFFAGVAAVVVGVVTVVKTWKWAGRRRSGIPTRVSNPAEVRGARPVE